MESYHCWLECPEPENLSFSELCYEIKNNRLIQIQLDNLYQICQWKDTEEIYQLEDGEYTMRYGTIYCVSPSGRIESVWTGDTKESLKEFIDTCNEYI